ncbi:hypothetical protein PF010_g989 [Phytophthora fragariae]|uniref:Secreted protein n=1 Tax=Phytophthora fragariae TaxID=53985 RepID=A0A6A3LR73_9STRA|nr:hypothetical protein PF011_g4797 [Phytophthora fragariae]KAE9138353.1 hypothetical protein PF010_g989 [Phytophthora fragariae]
MALGLLILVTTVPPMSSSISTFNFALKEAKTATSRGCKRCAAFAGKHTKMICSSLAAVMMGSAMCDALPSITSSRGLFTLAGTASEKKASHFTNSLVFIKALSVVVTAAPGSRHFSKM